MVQVRVSEGLLEGELVQNQYGGTYSSFKGIPYAQPPLGDLRFKAPQSPKPWEGVREAKEFGPICYQFDMFTGKAKQGSEDCLYLNVYTPDVKPDKPLPVMFWIHGGGFLSGDGTDEFYGPEFLVRQGVILVTINYRLEVLGFLCLNTAEIPGNAGMKDQVQALRWVNQNIANFGGDPANVTIFGNSAGGVSVAYHLISPMSKGLFRRAIPQSGTCVNPWGQGIWPRERALGLARKLGFHSVDDKELYEFFKVQPVETLVEALIPITMSEKITIDKGNMFLSVVDEKQFGNTERFFYGDVLDEVSNNTHDGVDIMVGYTSEDGLILIKPGDYLKKHLEMAANLPEYFVSRPLELTLPVNKQIELGEKLRKFYFNDHIRIPDDWEGLMKFYTMDMLIFDILQWTKFSTKKKTNKVYLYEFTCKSERNLMSSIMGVNSIIGNKLMANHMDELMYLFDAKVLNTEVDVNSEIFQLIDQVSKIWTNFAKYGNPTPDDSLGAKWLPYTVEEQDYMDIGKKLVPRKVPCKEEIQFWEKLAKEYGRRIYE